jgi:hypothetical protein
MVWFCTVYWLTKRLEVKLFLEAEGVHYNLILSRRQVTELLMQNFWKVIVESI